jgi:secondary thiamine-phosphate synthase enzyme
MEEIIVQTSKRRELINITQEVEKRIKIENGICFLFVPHATCALIMNEDEPLIKADYLNLFEKLVPENQNYNHNKIDNNADSHLLSLLFKPFLIIPIKNKSLYKGTWQEIFLAEFDGPRRRKVVIIQLESAFN